MLHAASLALICPTVWAPWHADFLAPRATCWAPVLIGRNTVQWATRVCSAYSRGDRPSVCRHFRFKTNSPEILFRRNLVTSGFTAAGDTNMADSQISEVGTTDARDMWCSFLQWFMVTDLRKASRTYIWQHAIYAPRTNWQLELDVWNCTRRDRSMRSSVSARDTEVTTDKFHVLKSVLK
jgi:hypothetical protein